MSVAEGQRVSQKTWEKSIKGPFSNRVYELLFYNIHPRGQIVFSIEDGQKMWKVYTESNKNFIRVWFYENLLSICVESTTTDDPDVFPWPSSHEGQMDLVNRIYRELETIDFYERRYSE